MKIEIKGTNIVLTESISNYVNSKFDSISKFVKDDDVICHIEVGKTTQHHKQGDIYIAEVRVRVYDRDCYVTSENSDLYTAIDNVKESLFNEITSDKEKRATFIKRSGARVKNMLKGLFQNNN